MNRAFSLKNTPSRRLGLHRHKYNARRTLYNNVWYDSKREAEVAAELDLCKKASEPKERVVKVERQVKYRMLPSPNTIIYVMDFRVTYADGHKRWIEVKGFQTAVSKLKHTMMRHFHPDVRIEIIK